jgi:peptidoglycan/LPS O-acetylase OafA/YrhL
MKNGRFESLDSLRGIAAITVVLSHLNLDYFNLAQLAPWIHRSVFHVFYDGEAAVVFFFVLSGFVLSYKYVNSAKEVFDKLSYRNYLLARFFRIYPLVIAVIGLTALLVYTVPHQYTTEPSSLWTIWWWKNPFYVESFFKQMTLIWKEPVIGNDYAPQTWTLRVEVLLSALVPVLILLNRQRTSWLILFNLMAIYLFDLPIFLIHFTLGLLLAQHLPAINAYVASKSRSFTVGLLLLGIFLYSYRYSIAIFFPKVSLLQKFLFDDFGFFLNFVLGVGVACILVSVLHSARLGRLLTHPFFLMIGRVSYSIYLCHFIIFIMLTPLAIQSMNQLGVRNVLFLNIFIAIFTLTATIVLSNILYHLVEKNGIALGKKVIQRLSGQ